MADFSVKFVLFNENIMFKTKLLKSNHSQRQNLKYTLMEHLLCSSRPVCLVAPDYCTIGKC